MSLCRRCGTPHLFLCISLISLTGQVAPLGTGSPVDTSRGAQESGEHMNAQLQNGTVFEIKH